MRGVKRLNKDNKLRKFLGRFKKGPRRYSLRTNARKKRGATAFAKQSRACKTKLHGGGLANLSMSGWG